MCLWIMNFLGLSDDDDDDDEGDEGDEDDEWSRFLY